MFMCGWFRVSGFLSHYSKQTRNLELETDEMQFDRLARRIEIVHDDIFVDDLFDEGLFVKIFLCCVTSE